MRVVVVLSASVDQKMTTKSRYPEHIVDPSDSPRGRVRNAVQGPVTSRVSLARRMVRVVVDGDFMSFE